MISVKGFFLYWIHRIRMGDKTPRHQEVNLKGQPREGKCIASFEFPPDCIIPPGGTMEVNLEMDISEEPDDGKD